MNQIPCPVCSQSLSVRIAHGRKSGKPFVMLVCGKDGRHIRAFISDRQFVRGVVEKAGIHQGGSEPASTGSTGTGGEGTLGHGA